MTYTRLGATMSTGKPEIYPTGPFRTVTDRVEVNDYDSAADGNGEAFDVSKEYGISRIVEVRAFVDDGSAYEAQFDRTNGSIRLFNLSDGTEVAQGTTVDVSITLTVIGAGSY